MRLDRYQLDSHSIISTIPFLFLFLLLPSPAAFSAEIEEIVVTARGGEETVREIPVAITAIGQERLDQFSMESFEDLEAMTPQLSIGRASSGSGASIAIRGIGAAASSIGIEQSVAVIIDGVYFPQGRVINEGLFDVGQVAILKGPQALYFGKNSTAGVISVQTNDPGDEFEAYLRMNNEFESDDLTLEGAISYPFNEKFRARLAVQASDMDKGWIYNNTPAGGDTYVTVDGFTGDVNTHPNPKGEEWWPMQETLYVRLTMAGDLSESFSYNVKVSYGNFQQNSSTGGGELFNCSALNGVGHTSQPVPVQPPGRQTVLFAPIPLPAVDCIFDGARGQNDVPPDVAAINPLLNIFGSGKSGEEFESMVYTANLDWSLENYEIKAILNYHDQTEEWVADQDGGANTSIFAGEENTFDNTSVEVRAISRFDSPLNFVVGAYYQKTNRWFDQDVVFAAVEWSGPIANPHDRFTAYNKLSETDGTTQSIYGELIWDITDRWQLTTGMRYIDENKDSYFLQPYVAPYSFFPIFFTEYDPADPSTVIRADQDFSETIPEVTLRWEATDNITAYAAYKEGFKSGGFSNSAILGNLSGSVSDFTFDPEENHGGEVGIKTSLFNNSMLLTAEVFHYTFDDLQVDFFNSQQFAYVTENAGGSITEGAEVQIEWATPIDGLMVSGSVGYLKSEFTDFENFCYVGQTPAQGCDLQPGQLESQVRQNLDGNTRPGAPEWSGFVAANYERPIGMGLVFGITANLQFKSETVLSASDPNAVYESYETIDANIRVGSQDGKWQVAFIGKNLTDELAIRGAGNVPGTGGNTGTAEGFRGDLSGGAIRPKQLEAQFLYRF
ncbi:MAG: TonB-dependent receptor [Proteobacteria bacterium]|jgi:iron complex outermembrane recepter protein|nr:TonB-dependent receptor [Pseudomonadota bacterium]